MDILVLGIGNRLMKDDGIGVYVAEELNKRHWPEHVRFAAGETDIDFCLNEILDSDFVVIVDAAILGKAPGVIEVGKLCDTYSCRGLTLPHDMHIFEFLKLVKPDTRGEVILIEPSEISPGLGLSPLLLQQFDGLVENIREIIDALSMKEA